MSKNIRKFLWGDLSYMEEYEAYFSDMSRYGLHLEKIGRFFLYFKEGKPKNLNYRIDLAKEDQKKTRIKSHEEKGWNFIDDKDVYIIFSSEEGSGLKELYPDPESQRRAIQELKEEKVKNPFLNRILERLVIIFLIGAIFVKIQINDGFYLSMANDHEVYSYLFFTVIPALIGRKARKNLRRLENTLGSGEFLLHEGDYELMNRVSIIRKGIFSLIVLFLIVVTFIKIQQQENINLNLVDNLDSLPIITISDIEDTDYEYDKSRVIKNDYIRENRIQKNWNLLVPKKYLLTENLEINKNNNTYIKPTALLRIDYYLGRFDFIAEGLERDILERENIDYGVGLKKIKTGDNISAYGVEKDRDIYLLLRKDRHVLFLKYYDGTASIDEIIEKSLEKLED